MKMILSPSKTLSKNSTIKAHSEPIFSLEAQLIRQELISLNQKQIQTFYGVSDNLAQHVFHLIKNNTQRAAIDSYQGEAFKHLDPYTWNTTTEHNAQESLRIISAMYGLLRPFDKINPYRLDFMVDFEALGLPPAYQFWSEKVTDAFQSQLKSNELVFNLASKEFSTVLKKHRINQVGHWIDVDFLVKKHGKAKTVSMVAKKARGLFARKLLESPIESIEDITQIKTFDRFELSLADSSTHYLRYIAKK
jgi:uncharacterized protein